MFSHMEDQERKAAIDALQTTITEGVQSGEPQALDLSDFKLRMHERHTARPYFA